MLKSKMPAILSDNLYFIVLITFLGLFGTHLLDNYPWLLVLLSLPLVRLETFGRVETVLIALFLVSVYITWYFIDKNGIFNANLIGKGLLVFILYLLGAGFSGYDKQRIILDRKYLYLFYGFFIAYGMMILYSYIRIPQDTPMSWVGMYVSFPNEYQRLHVNGGHLISTVIAYYLTFLVILVPLIVFYWHQLHQRLSKREMIALIGLGAVSFYIANEMARRIVLFLLLVWIVYFSILKSIEMIRHKKIKKLFLIGAVMAAVLGVGYYVLSDTEVFQRLSHTSIGNERRFRFWMPGLHAMLDHPWGGGHPVVIGFNAEGHPMKLSHNCWIDIGKDFGLIPFLLFCLVSIFFLYRLFAVICQKHIEPLMKHLMIMIGLSLFMILLIEPVFTSDKTFFAYIFFFFGLLSSFEKAESA